jgi:hypothetical protein
MAFVYHAYRHLLNNNGDKELVNEVDWGYKRLTGADLVQFQTDIEQAVNSVVSEVNAGNIVIEDLVEEVTLGTGQKLVVKLGEKLTFPNATAKFEFHPNYTKWAEVMKQDPNLTYKMPVWVDETP